MATTTKKATTKKTTKKAPAKAGDKAATAAKAAKAPATASKGKKPTQAKDGAKGGKPAAKGAPAESARTTVVRGDGREVAVSVPVDPTEAQDATQAKDGAKGGKPAAKAPKASKVEILTEAEAAKRGMTEILKTLKGKDAAMRHAAKAGGFVIEHEDGRYSAAKAQPEAEATEPEAPAKPKHSLETAPGKALDHMLKQGRRAAKAKAKAAEAKPAAKGAKPAKQPKPAKEKKVSALDAAAQVLAKAKQPMRAKELIEQMAAEGLWTSPGGKTPEATLYAAMIREIGKKGDESRFAKADRGSFVATGKGA